MNPRKQRKAGRLWARVALAAAVLVALALPLGAGSAMGSAPSVISPLAGGIQCNNGDPYWCLRISVSPTSGSPGTVTVDDCVTRGTGTQGNCPSGMVNRTTDYPATCPTNSFCSKGGLGIYAGDTVVLNAVPSTTGWALSGWSGNTTCTGNPCLFRMPASGTQQVPLSITATFVQLRQLSVTVSPSGGGTVTDDARQLGSCTSTCTASYANNTQVTLTATPASGYRFDGWSVCNGTGTCLVTMDRDKTVTATFVRVFALTIGVSGNGSVSYSPAGDGTGTCAAASCVVRYDAGTPVTLAAAAGSDPFSGWGGDCASSGTQPSCVLTMDADKSLTATFTPLVVTAPHFRLTVGVTGKGKVTTSGIDCFAQVAAPLAAQAGCQSDYQAGSSLTLVGAPEPGVNFRNWGGACAAFGAHDTCTLLMDNNKSVTATFSPDPVIGDVPPCSPGLQAPCEQSQLPGPKKGLLVSLSGADGGKVTGGPSGGAPTLASSRDTQQPIACGADSYVCYGDYSTGQTVTLKAKPAKGFVFAGWAGACKGKQPSCTLSLSEIRKVTATFAAKGKRLLNMSMRAPTFRVRWNESTGRGKLIVTGRIAGPAQLTFDLRRPHAGPLLHLRKAVKRAGAFRIVEGLPSRLFPKGARLLPGGKVVSIRGKASGFYVPMQVRTVQLAGPREGVVRRSFASVTRAGRSVSVFLASAKIGWANFRLEQQPAAGLALRVFWLWPNGRQLGSVAKANRPTVSSFLSSGQPLPRGCWRAELRVGGKLIKRQFVRIGSAKC